MRELAGRLAELDPDAGAALQVIAYFDRLMEGRVGIEALVRGAAVLSGCPARLVDERRGVRIRVAPDGHREDSTEPVDPTWPWAPLDTSGGAGPGARSAIPAAGPAVVSPGSRGAGRGSAPPGSLDAASASGRLGTVDASPVSVSPGASDEGPGSVPPGIADAVGPWAQLGTRDAAPPSASPGTEESASASARSGTLDAGLVSKSQGNPDAGPTPVSQGNPEAASASSSQGLPASVRPRAQPGTLDAVTPSESLGSLDAAPAPASPGTPDAALLQAPLDTPHTAPPQPSPNTPQPPTPLDPAATPTTDTRPDPAAPETPPALWLETPGPPDGVRAMILERAAGAVRAVLDRTRGWAPAAASAPDPALVEVVLDASAPKAARAHAAAQLGLRSGQLVCAVALYGGGAEIVPAGRSGSEARRAGVGPAAEPDGLPRSWAAARTALRLTAEGTARDPGPRTVYADELGGLALLADAVGPDTPPVPDELAVERAVAEAPWAAATLHAVSSSPSLRAAAAELTVHHSTLQERLVQTEHVLGWDVHSPQGRLRLQLALAVRKLRRTATAGQATEGARRSDVQ